MASTLEKLIVSIPLVIAFYLTVTCPCEKLLACHLYEFYLSLAAAAGLTFIFNQ